MAAKKNYVVRLEDLEPRPLLAGAGHTGGVGYDIFNADTVGAESLRLVAQRYAPGGFTTGHPIHTDREQTYYILSGTMHIEIDGEQYVAPAGSFVFIPRGAQHDHRNEGTEDMVFLTINTPVRSGEAPPVKHQASPDGEPVTA